MRYTVLLSPQALTRLHAVLSDRGTMNVLMDAHALLTEVGSPHDDCLVLDPALLTPAAAEALAANLLVSPRAIVAYSSVSTAALESAVVLAQRTAARFVFRGTPNERSALEQALLLAPDANLGNDLLLLLKRNFELLPSGLSDRLTAMFRNGEGPFTPVALAAAASIGRRTLDRTLSDAGFVSARRMIEAVRVASAYRAVTTSRTSMGHIAAVLGYKSKRTLDAQLALLLGTTSTQLRADPLSCAEAARRLAAQLTSRDASANSKPARAPRHITAGSRSLKLVVELTPQHDTRRNVSGNK